MALRRPGNAAFGVVLALAVAGCNKLVPVEGTIVMDGKPVQGASVAFMPLSAGGQAAYSSTDGSGRFSLKTNTRDGALAGPYKVLVTKTEIQENTLPDKKDEKDRAREAKVADLLRKVPDPQMREQIMREQRERYTHKYVRNKVHKDFGDVNATPLKVTIDKEGTKNLELSVY